jgi:alcohol/geraniol dehydrogenase (NADP+)
MTMIRGWAVHAPKAKLELFTFDTGALDSEEVEIDIEHCGICHADLSMIKNEWGMSQYPLIPGHEVVGKISALGSHAQNLQIGQRVGVGWNAVSCMHCHECMTGQHNLCAKAVPTMVGHQGGYADKIRTHWAWAIPLPQTIESADIGPLMCGGIAVFAPLLIYDIKPTDHVGIIGVGGLGHMGIKFAKAWGCEVTAFTSQPEKAQDAKVFGAHHIVSSRDSAAILKMANTLDMLMVTSDVTLDWQSLMKTLKPNGRLHMLGAVLEPLSISALDLIFGQKNISGSPTGSPAMLSAMLEFAARHDIKPKVEHFPMSKVNEALTHLVQGKARYRIVLDNDFA